MVKGLNKIRAYLKGKEVTIGAVEGHIISVKSNDNDIEIDVKSRGTKLRVNTIFHNSMITEFLGSPFSDVESFIGKNRILAQTGYNNGGVFISFYDEKSQTIRECNYNWLKEHTE